jgi:hypothetical protein
MWIPARTARSALLDKKSLSIKESYIEAGFCYMRLFWLDRFSQFARTMLSLALGCWKIRKIGSCLRHQLPIDPRNYQLIPAYETKLGNRHWETAEIVRFTVNLTLTA